LSRSKSSPARKSTSARRWSKPFIAGALLLALGAGAAWISFWKRPASEEYKPQPPRTLTFNKSIAPVIFENCAACHRPNGSGPFPLLSFAEVKKHARQIGEVTQTRYMPPWLPEPGDRKFAGERRLSVQQIGMIQQWLAEGAVEGASEDLPPIPKWREGWQLGTPDLVVTMPKAYALSAAGKDVYRNFVIPIPLSERRFVKAVEFRPGSRTVHHAFFLFDRTHRVRRLEKEAEPGFPGMSLPEGAFSPPGQFLGWQPGRLPSVIENMAWTLEPDTDLIFQLHMQPSGKPEPVQASLAFYFTDAPSSRTLVKVGLRNLGIDIPAGARNHVVEDVFTVSADADVLALSPHAHYLGDELQGLATLPDGTKKRLLLIKHWDFKWQNDYRFETPVFLPKGSIVTMRYSFDNSTNNVRNPNHPPKRVQYGLQTTDEMAELWLQLELHNRSDLPVIEKSLFAKAVKQTLAFNAYRLRLNPNDAEAHTRLGEAFFSSGNRIEAFQHFRTAAQLDPNYDEPHYQLGLMFRVDNQLDRARQEFETALRLNPENAKAHGNLGFIFASLGSLAEAESHLQNALELNPSDSIASNALAEVQRARRTASPQK